MLKKKIIFIVNVDWFFVSHRLPIALAAIQKGYEVHLICRVTDKQDMLVRSGIIIHSLGISRNSVNFFADLRVCYNLFFLIKKINPSIVHCVTIKPVLYGNLIGRLLKVPSRVSSISGLGFIFVSADTIREKILQKIISLFYLLALKDSDKVIFQNTSDRDVLKKINAVNEAQEVIIRGSGVDLKVYSPIDEPNSSFFSVMLIARLLIDKGVEEFALAAKIIHSKRDDVRMILVGDIDQGNPRSVTPDQLNTWLSEGIIEHWGYRNNMPEIIGQSNLIVLPSYREGLPKSLIEAAACARAVITTDVPGCRDAIEPNVTGLLVPIKSPESLAKAILKLIDDNELRKRLASNGRRLAESAFDIDDVVRKHIEIYHNL